MWKGIHTRYLEDTKISYIRVYQKILKSKWSGVHIKFIESL